MHGDVDVIRPCEVGGMCFVLLGVREGARRRELSSSSLLSLSPLSLLLHPNSQNTSPSLATMLRDPNTQHY
jgi:hypothetical protein